MSVPRIEAEITFLAPEDGGRTILPGPPWTYPGYMPHLVVGDGDGEYLGVRFVAGPHAAPGMTGRFVLELMYHPDVDYEALRPGATFDVREGGRTVGRGRVVSPGASSP